MFTSEGTSSFIWWRASHRYHLHESYVIRVPESLFSKEKYKIRCVGLLKME